MKLRHTLPNITLLLMLTLLATGCSTTRRIPADELLYTGIKAFEVKDESKDEPFPTDVEDVLYNAVAVKPNNALTPKLRYPFPLGLWVYNNWPNPKKGPVHWLRDKLVAEPVLISDVRPEVRTHMIDELLDNNGYFSGSASYELIPQRNKKKAKILYTVNPGEPYLIDSIIMLPDTLHLYHLIDSVIGRSKYLQPGVRFSTDSLSVLRINVANDVRNRGYYYFRPEFLTYLADSTLERNRIALKIDIADNIPSFALRRYRVGDVTTHSLIQI